MQAIAALRDRGVCNDRHNRLLTQHRPECMSMPMHLILFGRVSCGSSRCRYKLNTDKYRCCRENLIWHARIRSSTRTSACTNGARPEPAGPAHNTRLRSAAPAGAFSPALAAALASSKDSSPMSRPARSVFGMHVAAEHVYSRWTSASDACRPELGRAPWAVVMPCLPEAAGRSGIACFPCARRSEPAGGAVAALIQELLLWVG